MKNNDDLEPPDQVRAALKCPMCMLINPPSAMHCDCGYVFPAISSKAGSSAHLAPDERQCHICGHIIKKQAVECWYCAKVPTAAGVNSLIEASLIAAIPAWPWSLVLLLSIFTMRLSHSALRSYVYDVAVPFYFVKTFAQAAVFATSLFELMSRLTMFTGNFFAMIWLIRQGYWAKKVAPSSYALGYAVTSIVLMILSLLVHKSLGALFVLFGFFFSFAGIFSVKQTIEACFNRKLSVALSLLLGPIYFQYHFNLILKYRRYALIAKASGGSN